MKTPTRTLRLVAVAAFAVVGLAACTSNPAVRAADAPAFSAPDLPAPPNIYGPGVTPSYDGRLAPTEYQGKPEDVDGHRTTIAPGGNWYGYDPTCPGIPLTVLTADQSAGRYDTAPWVVLDGNYHPAAC